jgi:phosphopentomutase
LNTGKVVLIVLDGIGIGASPDARQYGDEGTNTLRHAAEAVGALRLPHLQKLGLGNIVDAPGVSPEPHADGCFGRMVEQSAGKDSTTGHWELGGLITTKAFPLYPRGFPKDVLDNFLAVTGCKGILGNKPASGTLILEELGDEHVRTGFPIVYTSGDSVFQVAAHEDVIPLARQYEICLATRNRVVVGEHAVGRVIARPFVGRSGAYTRTANRRDFALVPPGKTMLDYVSEAGIETIGVGKIDDLFCGQGLTEKLHTTSNAEGIRTTREAAARLRRGMVMTNLVDFDMMYGHRQDAKGMAKALEAFDIELPSLMSVLQDGDLLMMVADHGNDPADNSTDHSREYVPLLCYAKSGKRNVNLGTRSTFSDVSRTVLEYFSVGRNAGLAGNSFLSMVV